MKSFTIILTAVATAAAATVAPAADANKKTGGVKSPESYRVFEEGGRERSAWPGTNKIPG